MLLRGILHEGVRAFVDEYLGPPGAPVVFGGRDEDLQRLHAFHRGSGDRAVLCAEAGRGKSALLLRLAWRLDQQGAAVAWLPVSLRFGTHRSGILDALLTARLQALTGRTEHWKDLLASRDALPALILLDGLDELQDGGLLEALRGIALAPGVKLLVSARKLVDRDGTGWAEHLGWSDATVLGLDPLAYTGVAALTSAVGAGHLASEVMRRSGGDPLLVRLCAEALRDGLPLPDVRDPTELLGAWWNEQRARLRAPLDAVARRALAALAAARGVVPWSLVARAADAPEELLREALSPFARFLVDVPGAGLAFAHPRFADVARWSFPDDLLAAQRRYAALVVEHRISSPEDVTKDTAWFPAYLLHFAVEHLEETNAPDEILHGLLSPASLRAWRTREGGVDGFLREVRAAWSRSLRRVHFPREPGEPVDLVALERQAFARTLAGILSEIEATLDADLRATLVRHGLRSVSSALASVGSIRSSYDQRFAVERLLPALPDSALPLLLSMPSREGLPRAKIAHRLLLAGAHEEALELLLEGPDELALLALPMEGRWSAGQVEQAQGAVQGALLRRGSWAERFQMFAHLPDDPPRRELLDRLILEFQREHPRGMIYDEDYSEVDPRRFLAETLARLGRPEEALSWLENIRHNPSPPGTALAHDEGEPSRWPTEAIRAHLSVLPHLPEPLRGRAREALSSLPEARRLWPDGWALLLREHDAPAWIEAAWRDGTETREDHRIDAYLAPDLPPSLALRAERHLQERARRHLADLSETGDKEQATAALCVAWSALARGAPTLERGDRVEFFALASACLRRDEATRYPAFSRCLAWAILRRSSPEFLGEARALFRVLIDRGLDFWEIEGWEALFSFEERRALLEATQGAPLRPFTSGTWWYALRVAYSFSSEDAREARALLLSESWRLARHDAHRLTATLGTLAPEDLPRHIEELRALHPHHAAENPWLLASYIRDDALKIGLVRETLRRIPSQTYLSDDIVHEARRLLPEEECSREFRRILIDEGGAPVLHDALPLEEQRQVFLLEIHRSWSDFTLLRKLWQPSHRFEEGAAFRARGLAAMLEALKAPDQLPSEQLHALLWILEQNGEDLDLDTLLSLGAPLHDAGVMLPRSLGWRALALLPSEQDPSRQRRLRELLVQVIKGLEPDYQEDALRLSFRLALHEHRACPPSDRLQRAIASLDPPSFQEVWGSICHDLHGLEGLEEALAGQALACEPRVRLEIWERLRERLPEAQQAALAPAITEAALALPGVTGNEWFLAELPGDALRALWHRSNADGGLLDWIPLRLLGRLGGPEAALAWVRGVVRALRWFEAEAVGS